MSTPPPPKPLAGLHPVQVERRPGAGPEDDWVVDEAPLEIRLDGESFAVTLRTPGSDRELAAGFLLSEGVLRDAADLESVEPCRDPLIHDPDNVVEVWIADAARDRNEELDRARRERLAVAACGLCGKARIEDIFQRCPTITPLSAPVDIDLLRQLPDRMAPHQRLFEATGGLHAAALFDLEGTLLDIAEDVGRHNAVDKLIGASLLAGRLPWRDRILVVSARAGFEIVQKAMMARVPVLAAVGAASSLAVESAKRGGLELHSFVRPGRSNRHL
ncbi:MAG: formate dehydrogenase accessory sulfurtransferase FdhD [Acidobacteriota bacterium]